MEPELIDVFDGEDEIIFVLKYPDGRIVRKAVKRTDLVTLGKCECCGELVLSTKLDI